jgi:prefoldin subunit 5
VTHTDHLKKQIEDLEKQLQKKNNEIQNLYSLIDKIIQQENKNNLL